MSNNSWKESNLVKEVEKTKSCIKCPENIGNYYTLNCFTHEVIQELMS
jgi:hypothetical protein